MTIPRWLMGMPLEGGSHLLVLAMLANPTTTAYHGVRVRVNLGYTLPGHAAPLFHVYPWVMDAMFPVGKRPHGSKAFDLAPGRTVREWEASPAIAGTIVGCGGHVHDYATALEFSDATTGHVIWHASVVSDSAGRVLSLPVERFYRWYRLGIHIVPKTTSTASKSPTTTPPATSSATAAWERSQDSSFRIAAPPGRESIPATWSTNRTSKTRWPRPMIWKAWRCTAPTSRLPRRPDTSQVGAGRRPARCKPLSPPSRLPPRTARLAMTDKAANPRMASLKPRAIGSAERPPETRRMPRSQWTILRAAKRALAGQNMPAGGNMNEWQAGRSIRAWNEAQLAGQSAPMPNQPHRCQPR